jgi:hypothetical protein
MIFAQAFGGVGFFLASAVTVRGIFTLDEYQPTQWPVDALHWCAIAFASSFAERKSPVSISIFFNAMACAVCAMSMYSYMEGGLMPSEHYRTVYQGETEPFWFTKRHSFFASVPNVSYELRLAAAFVCAVLFFFATLAAAHRYWFTKFGTEKPAPETLIWKASVFFVGVAAVLALLPYPRWSIMDSPHTLLIFTLLVHRNPRSGWYWFSVFLLGFACVLSTMALRRTIQEAWAVGWLNPQRYRWAFMTAHAFGGHYAYEAELGVAEVFAASSFVLHACELAWVSLGWAALTDAVFF